MMTSKQKVKLLEEFQQEMEEQIVNCSIYTQKHKLDWDDLYEECGINASVCFTVKVLAKALEVNEDDLLKHVLVDNFGEKQPQYFDGERKRVISDNVSFVQFWEDIGWEEN